MRTPSRLSRPSRRGFTILEIVLALALLVMLLVPLAAAMGASHRSAARAEDLAYFQSVASTVLEAAAREDYQKVARASTETTATDDWTAWQSGVLGDIRKGVSVRSFVEPVDQHSLLFTVEVRWDGAAAHGRAAESRTRVSRVLVRPEASLSVQTQFWK